MRGRLAASLLLCSVLILSTFQGIAAPAPKAGSLCLKRGATQNYQGKKFTCIASGKKLVWDKGVLLPKPQPSSSPKPTSGPTPSLSPVPTSTPTPTLTSTPTPTPTLTSTPTPTPSPTQKSPEDLNGQPCTKENEIVRNSQGEFWCLKNGNQLSWSKNNVAPSNNNESPTPTKTYIQKRSLVEYVPPSLPSADIELCKIKQIGKSGTGVGTGFPRMSPLYQNSGTVKWALIPIDFGDLRGESDFLARIQDQMSLASEWIDVVSERKVKVEWLVQKDWITLPGSSREYAIPVSGTVQKPEVASFWQRAITETDKSVDLTGIQAIHFILPKGQTILGEGIKGYAWDSAVSSFVTRSGGHIGFFTVPGIFFDSWNLGRNYWSFWVKEYTRGLGALGIGDSHVGSDYQTYDIQASTEGTRELSGWLRFLLDWIPENRIYCQPKVTLKDMEITLVPLSDNNHRGIKMAVIPLTDSKALILESRRVTKFSCTTPTERNGVLAYVYDGKYGGNENYLSPISPTGREIESYSCAANRMIDPLLHEGDKVSYEGVTLEMLAHGDFDRVRITIRS